MASTAGNLDVKLQGAASSFIGSSLTVYQPVDASMIAGNGILFDIKGDDLGWFYDSSTDVVSLVDANGFSVDLTRKGDYYQWVIGSSDLGTEGTDPGSSVSLTCHFVAERNASGVKTRLASNTFTLIVKRMHGFIPTQISGLVGWWDAYSDATTVDAVVTTWDDKSRLDRDLTEATNKPTRRDTAQGRPYLEFDGTNDVMTTTNGEFGDPCTVFVAAVIDAYDATVRGIVQVGGTNGVRIAFDNANLKAISGTDTANGTLPSLDAWFVAAATKAAGGDVTIQKGTGSVTTQASAAAVTDGTLSIGDTAADAFADVGIAEVIVYNSVLSTGDRERVIRYLQQKWAATG